MASMVRSTDTTIAHISAFRIGIVCLFLASLLASLLCMSSPDGVVSKHCKCLCQELLSHCIEFNMHALDFAFAFNTGHVACAVLYVSQSCYKCRGNDRGTVSLDVVKLR